MLIAGYQHYANEIFNQDFDCNRRIPDLDIESNTLRRSKENKITKYIDIKNMLKNSQ
jgi:hypothetical protein